MKSKIAILAVLIVLFGNMLVFAQFGDGSVRTLNTDEELRQKLEKRTSLALDDNNTFVDLFKILKDEHDIQAVIDCRGAGALGITASSPIVREPFSLENVPLRRLLQLVLKELDLTYIIDEGFLQITSEEEAKKYMKIKIYDVADLVAFSQPKDIPVYYPNFGGPLKLHYIKKATCDFSELMDALESLVAPDTWDDPGSMMEFYDFKLLAIRQTDAVHEEIEQFLADVRQKIGRQKPQPQKISIYPNKSKQRRLFSR